MKIARLSLDQGPRFAALDEETGTYLVLSDDPLFGKIEATVQRISADDAHLVAPMIPRSKVVGYEGTFGVDAEAGGATSLADLTMFLKPNTSVVGPGAASASASSARSTMPPRSVNFTAFAM